MGRGEGERWKRTCRVRERERIQQVTIDAILIVNNEDCWLVTESLQVSNRKTMMVTTMRERRERERRGRWGRRGNRIVERIDGLSMMDDDDG